MGALEKGGVSMLESQSWLLLCRVASSDTLASTPRSSSFRHIAVVQWVLKFPSSTKSLVGSSYAKQMGFDSSKIKLSSLNAESRATVPDSPEDVEGLQARFSSSCQIFQYKELVAATSNFCADNFIGMGGNSRVFRGSLVNGRVVAVKVLKQTEDFVAEVDIITTLHHNNVISLKGYCFENKNLLLVYSYISRGSLEEKLHGKPLTTFMVHHHYPSPVRKKKKDLNQSVIVKSSIGSSGGQDIYQDSSDDESVTGDDIYDEDKIKTPRRSVALQELPSDYLSDLKSALKRNISTGCATKFVTELEAESILGRERYKFVQKTKPKDLLRVSLDGKYLHLYWKPQGLGDGFYVADGDRFIKISGPIRNQLKHNLCWAYVISDLISASRVLHGWEKEFKPLCTKFLCQNVDQTSFEEKLESMKGEENPCICDGEDIGIGLAYSQMYGNPEEEPGQEKFKCCERRPVSKEELHKGIKTIYKYKTLKQALTRLKTHPVAATLPYFADAFDGEVYCGPQKGRKYMGEHGVIMLDCRKIDGKMVVICKSSNGKDVGYKDMRGYIAVSLEVMFIRAGVRRSKDNVGERWCYKEPQYLLSEFYSIDMEYNGERKESDDEQSNNNKGCVLGGQYYYDFKPPYENLKRSRDEETETARSKKDKLADEGVEENQKLKEDEAMTSGSAGEKSKSQDKP